MFLIKEESLAVCCYESPLDWLWKLPACLEGCVTRTEQGAAADSLLVQRWYESAQPSEQNANNRRTEDVPHAIQ